MLAPRISLKQLLLSMIAVSIYLALVAMAYRGDIVAYGLAVSVVVLIATFVGYAMVYVLLATVRSWSLRRTNGAGESFRNELAGKGSGAE